MRKLWATVLAFLGIATFAEESGKKQLTDEQKTRLTETFGEQFVSELLASFDANTDKDLVSNAAATISDLQAKLKAAETEKNSLAADKTALEADKAKLEGTIADQKQAITLLSQKPEEEPPAVKISKIEGAWDDTNDKFLGGINQPQYLIDEKHAYNKRAYAEIMKRQGVMIPAPKASSLDYDTLKSDLGSYYRVRKQERIQSFLLGLPSVEKVFPLESGYQDQAVLVNLFLLDDFSQADNTTSTFDNVVKGSYKFEPETITMYDVMFAHKFTDLKSLEKNWIGYLNREGSSTMKWSFIEYILMETAKKLHNERELRRIRGERVNPTVNVAGTSLGAANGFLKFIKNKIDAFQIRPFVLGEWSETTISEHVRLGTSMVPSVVRDTGNLILYMSADALTAYHRNNEALYGLNQDYKPNLEYVKEYPNVKIEVVPNMAESKRLVWTLKGNIILLEHEPGEMTDFSLEQQDWSLKVWSNWKESVWAYLVGKKYSSLAEIPEDYSTQLIFCNDVDYPESYYLPMTADDTTPSVAKHKSIVSVANTKDTAITAIDDAVTGDVVHIKCGSDTHAITIAKSGNFSIIAAAWSPSLGDVLTLKKRSDGKWIELSRTDASEISDAFAADDATPSVSGGTTFVTNANTQATAITTLDDAVNEVVYTIYGAGSTNASTIANSGNFVLTAAMTLSTGAWIKLIKSETDGKFYEIERNA